MVRAAHVAIALMALVLYASQAVAADDELSPGQWRDRERFGLGFGFLANSFAAGAHIYGDYNFTNKLQFHIDLAEEQRNEVSLFGGITLNTTVTTLTGAVRYFPDDAQGWFIGGGSGLGGVKQSYQGATSVTSTTNFIPVFFDGGWQGWDGYYFTVNLQLGFTVETSSDDRTSSVPNISNQQSTAKQDFRDARSAGANGIFIGFGWYFPAPVKRAETRP